MREIFDAIQREVEFQQSLGFRDEHNTCGLWSAYIANYAGRWAMPLSFNPAKYTFRVCMVKVAALAVSAILWYDKQLACPDEEAVPKVNG